MLWNFIPRLCFFWVLEGFEIFLPNHKSYVWGYSLGFSTVYELSFLAVVCLFKTYVTWFESLWHYQLSWFNFRWLSFVSLGRCHENALRMIVVKYFQILSFNTVTFTVESLLLNLRMIIISLWVNIKLSCLSTMSWR